MPTITGDSCETHFSWQWRPVESIIIWEVDERSYQGTAHFRLAHGR
ncbi:MAG TPA: hypothetical protein VKB93_27050 [Thermoanaerobaculia bacterium]|nr:hypothetical protein [Thermoanaerobaculia bacterium]